MAVCPICDETYTSGADYRDHLAGSHRLFDDPGTETTIPEPLPEPADPPEPSVGKTKKRRGSGPTAPVQPPTPAVPRAASSPESSSPEILPATEHPVDPATLADTSASPSPTTPQRETPGPGRPAAGVRPEAPSRPPRSRPSLSKPSWLRRPARPGWLRPPAWPTRPDQSPGTPARPGPQDRLASAVVDLRRRAQLWLDRPGSRDGRYPLAHRYGDIALYAPGVLLILTCVVRGRSDVLGVVSAVLGTSAVMLAMMLPALHPKTAAPAANTPAATPPAPADPRTEPPLEELLAPPAT